MSKLTVILGPMKSGKSFEIINRFAFLEYTNISFSLFQPLKNIRDEEIHSRNGVKICAQKIDFLSKILNNKSCIIGIDEIHMFQDSEIQIIETLLKKDKVIVVCGLNTDYKGIMFESIRKLLEIGPDEVIFKKSACEICFSSEAVYTQIFDKNEIAILEGIPSVVPEDGTYTYKPVCRKCFKRK